MFHVVLWEPEIPPNTGNIARLCAATGSPLHLIGRRGFRLDDRSMKRAGLDYWPSVALSIHADWDEFERQVNPLRIVPVSSKVPRCYAEFRFQSGDCLLFGSESKGLPPSLIERFAANAVTIPMPGGGVRSLNLATAVAIVLYESLRQLNHW